MIFKDKYIKVLLIPSNNYIQLPTGYLPCYSYSDSPCRSPEAGTPARLPSATGMSLCLWAPLFSQDPQHTLFVKAILGKPGPGEY